MGYNYQSTEGKPKRLVVTDYHILKRKMAVLPHTDDSKINSLKNSTLVRDFIERSLHFS